MAVQLVLPSKARRSGEGRQFAPMHNSFQIGASCTELIELQPPSTAVEAGREGVSYTGLGNLQAHCQGHFLEYFIAVHWARGSIYQEQQHLVCFHMEERYWGSKSAGQRSILQAAHLICGCLIWPSLYSTGEGKLTAGESCLKGAEFC